MALLSGLGQYRIGIIDHTLEDAEFDVFIEAVDDTNYTAFQALAADFDASVADLIVGNSYRKKLVAYDIFSAFAPATDPTAQRESEWLILYWDAVTHKPYSFRIVCPDVSDTTLRLTNSDFADTGEARWIAFITAFEALAVCSETGNAVTFRSALLVASNS